MNYLPVSAYTFIITSSCNRRRMITNKNIHYLFIHSPYSFIYSLMHSKNVYKTLYVQSINLVSEDFHAFLMKFKQKN